MATPKEEPVPSSKNKVLITELPDYEIQEVSPAADKDADIYAVSCKFNYLRMILSFVCVNCNKIKQLASTSSSCPLQ